MHDKNESQRNKRILVVKHDCGKSQAMELAKDNNCRVISESWVIKSIYDDCPNIDESDKQNLQNMPIYERIDFDAMTFYDIEQKEHGSDSESQSQSESDDQSQNDG